MDKVLLTKAQAEALEKISNDMPKAKAVGLHAGDPGGWYYKELNGLPLDDFIRSLYFGYEIKEPPKHINLPSVRIWKSDYMRNNEVVERYNVRVKELEITFSVCKDTHTKTYQKLDAVVKGE